MSFSVQGGGSGAVEWVPPLAEGWWCGSGGNVTVTNSSIGTVGTSFQLFCSVGGWKRWRQHHSCSLSLSSSAAVNAGATMVASGPGASAGNAIKTGDSIRTLGDGSAGIYVQSLGGSGGTGGSASTIQLGGAGTASVSVGVTSGKVGGASGNVTVENSATIETGLITKRNGRQGRQYC